jgi:hypothetical protein
VSGMTTGTLPFGLRPGRPLGLGASVGSMLEVPLAVPPMAVSSILMTFRVRVLAC